MTGRMTGVSNYLQSLHPFIHSYRATRHIQKAQFIDLSVTTHTKVKAKAKERYKLNLMLLVCWPLHKHTWLPQLQNLSAVEVALLARSWTPRLRRIDVRHSFGLGIGARALGEAHCPAFQPSLQPASSITSS
jgi:hypothetical protein